MAKENEQSLEGELSYHGLTRCFGDLRAVDNVSFRVPAGQFVGVIGPSGAGKSTLLRLTNRLLEPTSGRIRFGNTDVTALKGAALRRWRAQAAMIFQQFNLVGRLDVLTNVMLGRLQQRASLPVLFKQFSSDDRARAILALDRLGMADFALQRADHLSGGQQQRVAIARALVQNPAVLLADEPIASLDPHSAKAVMDALKAINKDDGITVLCNLHTIDTARDYSDRIIGLSAGRIVFDDNPDELSADKIAAIYGSSDQVVEGLTSTSLGHAN